MTLPVSPWGQGPPGSPAAAILGPAFTVPPSTGGPAAQQVTISLGNTALGAPTSAVWAFAPMSIGFSSPPGVSPPVNYGSYQIISVNLAATPNTITIQNNGASGNPTPGTIVPAGSGISSVGPPGPIGTANSILLSPFNTPAPGVSASANIANASNYPVNTWLNLNDGTNVGWFQVSGAIDSTHLNLLNPSVNTFNPFTNVQFQINAIVIPTGAPGGPAGSQNAGGTNLTTVPIPVAQAMAGAGALVVWSLPLPVIAVGETMDIVTRVTSSSLSTPDFCTNVLQMTLKNMGGTILTLSGGTTATDITQPSYPLNQGGGTLLATTAGGGTQMNIVTNSTVQITVMPPATGVTGIQISGLVSYRRSATVSSGNAVTVTAAGASSGSADGGTVFQITVSPSTNGVTQVNLAGVQASFSVADSTHLTIISAPNPPGVLSGTIVVFNAGGPSTGGPPWAYFDSFKAIFGNILMWLGTPANILNSSGNVTGWQDSSGNYPGGNGTINGTAPTYSSADAAFSPAIPAMTFASNGYLTFPNMPMGSSDPAICFGLICAPTSVAANNMLMSYGTGYFLQDQATTGAVVGSTGRGSSPGSIGSLTASRHLMIGYIDPNSAGAGGVNSSLIDSNTLGNTVSGTSTAAGNNATFAIGARSDGLQESALKVAYAFLLNGKPTSAMLTRAHALAQTVAGTP